MRLQPQTTAPEIYVLFRVFELEAKTGLRIYVDPASCREAGKLNFKVETWSVTTV